MVFFPCQSIKTGKIIRKTAVLTYFSAAGRKLDATARAPFKSSLHFLGNFFPADVQAAFAYANLPSPYRCLRFPTK